MIAFWLRPIWSTLVDGGHLVQHRVGIVRGHVVGHGSALVALPLHGADELVEVFLRLLDGVGGQPEFTPGALGGRIGELLCGDGVLVVDERLVDLFLPHGDGIVEIGDVLVDAGDLCDELRLT